MGAGPEFCFTAMDFALGETYKIDRHVYCPHPIALAAMKLRAFYAEPALRKKDLADVAEMVWGLVEKGSHFEIQPLWEKINSHDEALFVRKTLYELGVGQSAKWDLEDARKELVDRNFSQSDVDEIIPARLLEFVENLPL